MGNCIIPEKAFKCKSNCIQGMLKKINKSKETNYRQEVFKIIAMKKVNTAPILRLDSNQLYNKRLEIAKASSAYSRQTTASEEIEINQV